MTTTRSLRRAATVVVGSTAALALATGTASAHHCLKEWNDAARAQVAAGTPWAPLSDFMSFAIVNFLTGGTPECAAHADEFTLAYMDATDIATEPTIHMKATVGGGAAHQGRDVVPFEYLDFGVLEALISAEEDCADVVFD
ncbi:MAG TPA: hypothetical protein VNT31_07225 [Nocardioides sp.]|nr:hypothetical protein [Nocardioides sp.]